MIMVLGERMNLGRRIDRWETLAWKDAAAWFRISSRLGLYEREYAHFKSVAQSRERLASIGVDIDSCRRMNLLPPAERGAWDPCLAEHLADEYCWLMATLPMVRRTLLLGSRLAEAFQICTPRFVEMRRAGCRFVVLPHPSGVCRWWNDVDEVAVGREMLQEVLR